MSTTNLASRYAKQVDERFHRESQALLALNNDFKFTGVKTVHVYSIPTVAMTDYVRSGNSRYGTATDLARSVQSLTVRRDRSYNFIIDKGDKLQTEMVMDAGRALARQIREVVVPEYDTYIFATLAAKAVERGNYSSEPITRDNAYAQFLAAMEALGDRDVPDKGRVCFCSYRFANLIKQDPAFMKSGSASQEMLSRGVVGEVDGCQIVKVPSGRLPAGAAFILTHPMAAIAPKQLEEYKIHDNPPGISGWLVEGRFIYDCFVLEEKADAVFYHGAQGVMKNLHVTTAPAEGGKAIVTVIPGEVESGHSWVYASAASAADTAREMAALRAQGEYEKAEAALKLGQEYLERLQEMKEWTAEHTLSVEKFNESLRQWEAEYALDAAKQQLKTTTSSSTAARKMDIEGLFKAAAQNGGYSWLKQKSVYTQYGLESAPSKADYDLWLERNDFTGKDVSAIARGWASDLYKMYPTKEQRREAIEKEYAIKDGWMTERDYWYLLHKVG